MQITYCFGEDRNSTHAEVGLRIAIASLKRHELDSRVIIYRPNASNEFQKWLQQYSHVQLRSYYPDGARSWNCKPHILTQVLEEGADYAVWIDSDIVVMRSCDALFKRVSEDQLIVTQEFACALHQGTYLRTIGWELPVGRSLPRTINSCVIRASHTHRPLLRHWKALLDDARYQTAQRLPIPERPIHALSDQDVLNALLGSQDYKNIPVHYVQTGRDIVQSGGARSYSSVERIRGLFHQVPYFFHGQGAKPWDLFDESNPRKQHQSWFKLRFCQEISPYFGAIKEYRDAVAPLDQWMNYKTWYGSLIKALGIGHYALCGLPITMLAEAVGSYQTLRYKIGVRHR